MIGENWQLVTDEPAEFWEITGWSSRLQENYIPIILEEFIEYTPIW